MWTKPKPLPILITTIAVGLFIGLGVWQLARMQWKETLISDLQKAAAAPVESITNIPIDQLPNQEFRRVSFTCGFPAGKEIHIAARYRRDVLGYHVLRSCLIKGYGEAVYALVNVGWIPTDKKDKARASWYNRIEEGPMNGMIRIMNRKGWFTPANQPDKNLWFWYDHDAMETYTERKLVPIVLDRLDEKAAIDPQADTNWPIGLNPEIKLRNDHLGYALTWFAVALSCLVIFLIYHRKK